MTNIDPKLNHIDKHNHGCEPCLSNKELTDGLFYYYPKKGKGKVYLCLHHTIKMEKMGFSVFEAPIKRRPQGGKRQGAGRKSHGEGSHVAIPCGKIEDELRADIMALPPRSRKYAMICLVKLAKAKTQGEFIVAFRDVLRDWEGTDRS